MHSAKAIYFINIHFLVLEQGPGLRVTCALHIVGKQLERGSLLCDDQIFTCNEETHVLFKLY